ncbi:MAG: 23S rRNA (uracil(1939)-C(5))-methyltransferase RlmD [Lachnospiraceae bacterium]|nr:23S rRNA (uracil(1939)-C(5))-methyltransferase RlmD [Lachnospiraceae bacterium]
MEETLIRETLEETGLRIIPESITEFGYTEEVRRDKYDKAIFDHFSYYFLAEAEEDVENQRLDKYEREEGYKLKWVPVEEAIAANSKLNKKTVPSHSIRDNKIFALLKNLSTTCKYSKKCGACKYQGVNYDEQLKEKQKIIENLVKKFCEPEPIIGMNIPYNYRNKVHAVFDKNKNGDIISGIYVRGTHEIVPIDYCQIEDYRADLIMATIRRLTKEFKIKTYNEDTGYGFLRHVLIRTGNKTGEVMVVLVVSSPIFPSKNNFVSELRKEHPYITTVVVNVNAKKTSFVLGDKESTAYGMGYIYDILCGCKFKISPRSFYQINSLQTEVLYKKAIEMADLQGNERVIDAYCGIGTIGIIMSKYVKNVIGVELNKEAVKDAIVNSKINKVDNIRFVNDDAGRFMMKLAARGERVDVVVMDPPRSGSDEKFLSSLSRLSPKKIVYISCGPETMVRDVKNLINKGYSVKKIQPVDMFPHTSHVECVTLLQRKNT